MQGKVTLRLLDKADKEIKRLPRVVKGAIYDFQYKFRENPHSPGLRLKQLKGHDRLYSARVADDYRALLLHVGDGDYILVAVRHRNEVYDNLERFHHQVNPVTGGIEFLEVVESTTVRAPGGADDAPVSSPAGSGETAEPTARSVSAPVGQPTAEQCKQTEQAPSAAPSASQREPLLAAFSAEQLRELGVAEALIPLALDVTTDEKMLGLVEYAPAHSEEVLLALADGKSFGDVLESITQPVKVAEPVDVTDYSAALRRSTTRVTTEDTDLREAIEDGFGRWKVYLHPTQEKLVKRRYKGPARVSGGPGTGKTIVALHRVKYLVDRLSQGRSKAVLLTTYNRNLAGDLRKRLLDLGGQEVVDRVHIVNIDSLATQIVAEAAQGGRRRWITDAQALDEWQDMLTEIGETRWDAEFLNAEWSQVILGQAVNSRADYFRARRAGRGQRISRAQRAEIWQLVERFTMGLDEKRLWTHRQVAEIAARIKGEQAAKIAAYENAEAEHGGPLLHRLDQSWATLRHDYQHIVVDEAQDLNPAHWKLLRAMVAEKDDDIFLVGDTHQRIYDNYVSLASLGVNIRGRSSRLTLSYRTTKQILGSALGLLGDETWDDLDDGTAHLGGYRSILQGPAPTFVRADTWDEEMNALAAQVSEWRGLADEDEDASIAVAVPTRDMVGEVEQRLRKAGIRSATIGPDGPRVEDAVHVGTLHRFKGLEYRFVAIAGMCEGLVPRRDIERFRDADPLRCRREVQKARSLIFVAATRARDALAVSWHGAPSPFVPAKAASAPAPNVGDGLFKPTGALF
ncbi:DNA helicase [Nocardiopsis gilva YIM 90087]|uniref:DNA 3'-5' helicase n=1 Tax=Nocardiopsis gilva YIM 90087 TaxID=1235441 RepID=A0A223S477_9ACTN|nr:UvrD-helicase domain-containing protein [Nocardiopsis gilva]ASU82934.1 DNA helicase [Nocardiopsis gilva YIM 90087]